MDPAPVSLALLAAGSGLRSSVPNEVLSPRLIVPSTVTWGDVIPCAAIPEFELTISVAPEPTVSVLMMLVLAFESVTVTEPLMTTSSPEVGAWFRLQLPATAQLPVAPPVQLLVAGTRRTSSGSICGLNGTTSFFRFGQEIR